MFSLSTPTPAASTFLHLPYTSRLHSFSIVTAPSRRLHPSLSLLLLLCPRSRRFRFAAGKRFSSVPVSEDEEEEEDEEDEEYDEDEDEEDVAAAEYGYEYESELSDEDEDDREGLDQDAGLVGGIDGSGFEKHKWERVARVLRDVKAYGEDIINYQEIASVYDFPLDKFQRLSIQAFLGGASVVVSAPTSSGKTLIAEAAALATVARGRRIFYTTPLKALSNQKFREFRDAFGESYVGLLTGDSAVNRDAQIIIMTTEILRNMLYQSVGMNSSWSKLYQVDMIVLDEVHYLSDISRGTVWEEIVIYCPKDVQLICLSATVANPDELAGWISQIHGKTELVTTKTRPVPLLWHFSLKNSLSRLLNEKGTKMNRKLSLDHLQISNSEVSVLNENGARRKSSRKGRRDQINKSNARFASPAALSKNDINTVRRSQVPLIRDTLRHLRARNMLPAIWFIFSRKGCDAAVEYLEGCNLLDEFEVCEVELALNKFKVQYPDAIRESAVRGLLHGVASHHAGCLPLWKSFIEELFQQGLVKVVFATETLAAGINMPARTTVIASLSKRRDSGRGLLSSNELHQMAGRAGRRGIDKEGHVVLVQTPYEGAEESCEILFTGLEPLVSQFKASYGMVLNLLAGEKVTHKKEIGELKSSLAGQTLDEARKLVEQSFGNYVGSNVMVSAKEELKKIKNEIELLSLEVNDDAIDQKCQELMSEAEHSEITRLQEQLRVEKRQRTQFRKKMALKRMADWKPILEDCENDQFPFICLHYKDHELGQHFVSAIYIGKLESLAIPHVVNLADTDSSDKSIIPKNYDLEEVAEHSDNKPSYHIALGSDNSWYLFTERWIKMVYKTGFPDVPLAQGDALPRKILQGLLMEEDLQWEKIANSEYGNMWCREGSLDTWSWSLNIPVLSSFSEEDEINKWSQSYKEAMENYQEQKRKVSRLKKQITNTKGFKQFKKVMNMTNLTKERIGRLNARSKRLIRRIEQIEPSGWKEFLQISNVIHEARALDINTSVIFPLGETAAAIRGENELWMAMVLRNQVLLNLKPTQLAAVCACLVSEGIKVRPWKTDSYIYEPSSTIVDVFEILEEQRITFMELQEKHGVKISCVLDIQFSGMVEAWASGLTWREIMMDCAMDEGDLARLLRRTIDLLVQIPKLPVDSLLHKNAKTASSVMNRSPISELAG